ncbi:MAG: STAS domain-containing protein [Clostridia bacterium]|nr:STAS domain-containing protein [Clostridia bacterium]MBN2881989.1 STAS domain-containing protein [Clostridia bacterium]
MKNLQIEKKGEAVYLTGEVDVGNCSMFKEELNKLIEESEGMFVLDFLNLSYIDSAGLGILVGMFKRLAEKSRELTVINANDYIKKLFRITKLDTLFKVI